MDPCTRHLATMSLALSAGWACAQATAGEQDAMPLADYLGLLEQIAPAARQGAEAYLHAYRRKCGRALTTGELRRAMSKDGADPALMGLIRASQAQDAKAILDLGKAVPCGGNK